CASGTGLGHQKGIDSMAGHDRIVIRRKRVIAATHQTGNWKIAYADFVTAMMAFFLVMWLLSLVPSDDLKAIAEYFRMPLMEAVQGGPHGEGSNSVVPGGSSSIIPNPYSLTAPVEGGGNGRQQQMQIEVERRD